MLRVRGTVAYLGHGGKTNSAYPHGRNTNPSGQIVYSVQADYGIFHLGALHHYSPGGLLFQGTIPPVRNSH